MGESHLRPALVIIGVIALAYCNSLSNSFQYDDEHSLVENPHVRSLFNLPDFFTNPQMFSRNIGSEMYRPLVLSSYALNYAAGQYEVRGYHLFNIAIHLIAACLLYAILWSLNTGKGLALLGGLLFGLHPLTAEPVNYISSRSESLAGLFYLAGFFLYVRAAEKTSILSLLCFVGGLLSKSIVLTLPAVLLVYEWAFRPQMLRSAWRRHWPYWVVAAGYLWGIGQLIREAIALAPVRSWTVQFCTQIKALVYYLKLLVLPRPLSVEHQFFEASSWWEGTVLFSSILLLSLALAVCHWLQQRGREGMFWCAWMLSGLLPTLIVPLNVLVNERRLYLSLAGFVGLLLWLCKKRAWPRSMVLLSGAGLLCLMALTVQRNRVWKSEASLWEDARQKAPLMVRPHLRVGTLQRQAGQLDRAEAAYQTALEIDPANAAAFNNLGNLYKASRGTAAAEQAYKKALAALPSYAEALINLAVLYSEQDRLDEALVLYQRALPLSRKREEIYNNLGTTYLRMERYAEAEQVLRQALVLSRGRPGIYRNLGGALEGQGRDAEALEAYEQAVELDPAYAKAYFNLGLLCEKLDRPRDAVRAYERFLDNWQGDPAYAAQVRQRLQEMTHGGK